MEKCQEVTVYMSGASRKQQPYSCFVLCRKGSIYTNILCDLNGHFMTIQCLLSERSDPGLQIRTQMPYISFILCTAHIYVESLTISEIDPLILTETLI